MKTVDFEYALPEELIAQKPVPVRDESRLLVLNRNKRTITHTVFKNLSLFLEDGDILVMNDTRVIPARLIGVKEETGARIEFLLLRERNLKLAPEMDSRLRGNDRKGGSLNLHESCWEVLSRPARRMRTGKKISFNGGRLKAVPEEKLGSGKWVVRFECSGKFSQILDEAGEIPIPPYIRRRSEEIDRERYQTVYAKKPGAVAAPTAGLHFTESLLNSIRKNGVKIVTVTIHPGLGTFRPINEEDLENHSMESEYYEIGENVCRIISGKKSGKKVVAVGTTATRVLETAAGEDGKLKAGCGWTNLFIYPGYKFKVIDSLITNFHPSRSTTFVLTCTFCGRDFLMSAYHQAIGEKYRFFSYGDATLIL